jgi:hypothetical protein
LSNKGEPHFANIKLAILSINLISRSHLYPALDFLALERSDTTVCTITGDFPVTMSQSLHLFTPSTLSKQCYSYPKPSFPTFNRRFTATSVRFSSIRACSSDLDPSSSQLLLASDNGKGGGVLTPLTRPTAQAVDSGSIEVDAVTEAELKENGFRSTRRTKLVCTIGPATCGFEQLEALAVGGMNVARINMCHGTRAWHRAVIERVRRLNDEKGYAVAIMMDTEGSEIHMGDFGGASSAKAEVIVYSLLYNYSSRFPSQPQHRFHVHLKND